MDKLNVGVSSCLLGINVRFDGGHKKDAYILGTLNDYFEWKPVCPEVEVGMSTPRESLRLIGDPQQPRMVANKSGVDWTDRMNHYARSRVKALKKEHLHGYILKSKSPSCGMERVKIYTDQGMPGKTGRGLFAEILLREMPILPVEEEGRLHDPHLRENFIIRVFSHYRWSRLLQERFKPSLLVDFHSRHKFLVMAHSEKHMRALGRLISQPQEMSPTLLRKKFEQFFFEALSYKATARKHTNVLQHIAGFFKKKLDTADRAELKETIDDYHKGLVPLIVPITLIRHHARRLGIDYLNDQVYLNPHPKEMMLMNHV